MVTSSNHVAATTNGGEPQKKKKKLVLNAFVEMCMLHHCQCLLPVKENDT